jgi:hypothetical protein
MPTPPSLPSEASLPPTSLVGQATSAAKLRGEVYTPLEVALGMVRRMRWPADGPRLLDPSCGDGVFLEAVMRRLVELDLPVERAQAILREHVQGWDAHAPAIAACRERLLGVSAELGLGGAIPTLVVRDAIAPDDQRFHAVLGNPPYLEAKRMPAALKAHIKRCCPVAARGAFDLYGAFVERAFAALEPGGELCFIIPNRFLVTAYARALRRLLLGESLVRVVDLSTSRVFADAAVYPVVVLARRGVEPGYRVESWDHSASPVVLPAATLRDQLEGLMPLPPASPGGRSLLARSLAGAPFDRLDRHLDIRWAVSFHKAGLRDGFVFEQRPEPAVDPRPFLGGGRWQGNREVEPYRVTWGGWWIDYDTERARAAGNPLPPLEVHAAPKVVLCQNARRGRAALDREGLVLKDTFLSLRCLVAEDRHAAWLEWAVLVLNSRLFHYLYEHLYGGTRKGGGYLHFLSRYLQPFPVPPPFDADRVRAVHAALEAGDGDIEAAEALVWEAWGVTDEEAEALDAYGYPEP